MNKKKVDSILKGVAAAGRNALGNTISYALKYRKGKIAQKHNSNSVMGYTFNPCKSTFCNIPCNQKMKEKEWLDMEQNRVRIVDVADALGLSTATVSKVIQEEVLQ